MTCNPYFHLKCGIIFIGAGISWKPAKSTRQGGSNAQNVSGFPKAQVVMDDIVRSGGSGSLRGSQRATGHSLRLPGGWVDRGCVRGRTHHVHLHRWSNDLGQVPGSPPQSSQEVLLRTPPQRTWFTPRDRSELRRVAPKLF